MLHIVKAAAFLLLNTVDLIRAILRFRSNATMRYAR
jgi:hypothetical protein